jgi:hypothetical protein
LIIRDGGSYRLGHTSYMTRLLNFPDVKHLNFRTSDPRRSLSSLRLLQNKTARRFSLSPHGSKKAMVALHRLLELIASFKILFLNDWEDIGHSRIP